jgi:hypothetical protein
MIQWLEGAEFTGLPLNEVTAHLQVALAVELLGRAT